jgi:hypothetical protein
MLRLTIVTVALALTGTSALANSRGLSGNWRGEAQSSFQNLYSQSLTGQSLTGTTARPSNRDTRMAPAIGGRGMQGGGRANGGMGRR